MALAMFYIGKERIDGLVVEIAMFCIVKATDEWERRDIRSL
ncbi:hypothetical protein AB4Z22_03495 [Paenibacillus sp. TAF58]